MQPEAERMLNQIIQAARLIVKFTTGRVRDDLGSDELLRAGVYLEFIMIGEHMAQLAKLDELLAEQISEHWRIIGFRNQIVHAYARIDDEITWRIIESKLPVLIEEVEGLLRP